MRFRKGDTIYLTDGKGYLYEACIIGDTPVNAVLKSCRAKQSKFFLSLAFGGIADKNTVDTNGLWKNLSKWGLLKSPFDMR